jgi:hypothetical protein
VYDNDTPERKNPQHLCKRHLHVQMREHAAAIAREANTGIDAVAWDGKQCHGGNYPAQLWLVSQMSCCR